MKLLFGLLFTFSLSGATLLRIQCGGPGGIDSQGQAWQADQFFAGGASWDSSNQKSMGILGIPYRTLRYSAPPGSPFSYSIPMNPGDYTVTLKFVEPNKTGIGQRVFNVSISIPVNGGTVNQQSLDLFAVAPGMLQPYDISFPITVVPGASSIQISLTPTIGNAVISGIQVDDSTPPVSTPTFVTGLESAPPPCPSTGLTFFYATDTDHLSRCYAGGPWKPVGDVRSTPPVVKQLQECHGSGTGWSCDGLLWATFQLADNSILQLFGAAMPSVSVTPGTSWTPKQ